MPRRSGFAVDESHGYDASDNVVTLYEFILRDVDRDVLIRTELAAPVTVLYRNGRASCIKSEDACAAIGVDERDETVFVVHDSETHLHVRVSPELYQIVRNYIRMLGEGERANLPTVRHILRR
jgi:hypothetical protein